MAESNKENVTITSGKRARPADCEDIGIEDSTQKLLVDEDYIISGSDGTFLRFESDPDAPLFESKELIFHPEFTNQIYRQEEEIHGYKDLKAWVHILGGSLQAYLTIEYSQKKPDADDIKDLLVTNVFQKGFVESKESFQELKQKELSWKPPGKPLSSYQVPGQDDYTYQIYHATFQDEGAADYLHRVQAFAIFYINGASFVEESYYWDFYLVYRVDKKGQHTLCAYSNTYSFYQTLNKKRVRIAQFVVLPPFQRKQHGSRMLKAIYNRCINDPECFEITVEDSALEFQHVRDCADVELCIESGYFKWIEKYRDGKHIKLEEYDTIQLPKKEIEEIRKKCKITKNQILRVFEILKLAAINPEDMAVKAKFKVDVKLRLFTLNQQEFWPFHNKKMPYLMLDGQRVMVTMGIFSEKNMKTEAIEVKLEEYYAEIEDQYLTILSKVKKILGMP